MIWKRFMRVFLAVMLLLWANDRLCSLPAFAHPGGLDANGGHHDRKNGGYHFHKGPLQGNSYKTQEEALAALRETGTEVKEKSVDTPKQRSKNKNQTDSDKGNGELSESANSNSGLSASGPAVPQEPAVPADALYQRGMSSMAEGDYEAAERYFREAAQQGHKGAEDVLKTM